MLDLTLEQNALFTLLQISLNKKVTQFSEDNINWTTVRNEASKQAVFLLASSQIERLAISKEEKQNWLSLKYSCIARNVKSANAILEMDRVMRSNGYKYVILKGLAAASYYPDSFLRMLGDVDFLIDDSKKSEVVKALENDGYENWNTEHNCHVVFRKPKQHLEMHFETVGIPDGIQGEYVREYMKNALDETNEYSLNNKAISLPINKYHGLILLLHMQHHMLSEGIGLRHLMDWCCFVDKTHNEPFWESDLLPIFKKIGLYKYAQVMTKTGSMYFKTECPEWCSEAEEKLCDDVMQDILIGGNFGRKNMARARSGMMISQHGKQGTKHGKLYNLFVKLRSVTENNHPIVRKIPVLYPVYFIYYSVRWVFRVLTGKRSSLFNSVKYADERLSVYSRLKVFEI